MNKEVAVNKDIDIRLRLIIVKQDKVLLTYYSQEDYYSYAGGKLEYGETIAQGAQRELMEECGEDTKFSFGKILYIRDYISPPQVIHSVELFILGNINKFKELEGKKDPESNNKNWLTWKDIYSLPSNLYPSGLTQKLIEDYRNNFPNQGEYLGNIGSI